MGWAGWVKYAPVIREKRKTAPRLLQVSAGRVQVRGDTAQQWRSGQESRGALRFPVPLPRAHPAPGPAGHTRAPLPLRSPPSRQLSAWPRGPRVSAAAAQLRAGARGPGQCGGGGPGLPRRGLGLQRPRPRRAPLPSAADQAPTRGWRATAVRPGRGPAERRATGGGSTKGGGAGTAGGTAARRARACRQVWSATSARVPRRAPPARLGPALPNARRATPGAAAASWRGPPRASRAARSAGSGRPPPANQEIYAKLEAGPRAGSPRCLGPAVAGSTPPSLQTRLLQFTARGLKLIYFVYLLFCLSPSTSPGSKALSVVHS